MYVQNLIIGLTFSFPFENEDIRILWYYEQQRGWENLKIRRSFSLTLFHAPYSVSCAVVAFTLSILIKPLLPEGTGFVCKGLSCIWLFLFSHFHIFTLEFQLSFSSCSNISLRFPWGIFPEHPQSFVCYGSICLCGFPWKLSRKDRNNPKMAKKAIPLHNVQDFLKKHFVTSSLLEKGMQVFLFSFPMHYICLLCILYISYAYICNTLTTTVSVHRYSDWMSETAQFLYYVTYPNVKNHFAKAGKMV